MAQVPTLVLGQPGGRATPLAQSMAILEYLEEVHPEPPLMPADALSRAAARQFSEGVVSGIHPLQNLRVMRTVGAMYGVERDGQLGWARHWIMEGFEALEALAQRTAGAHVIGDAVSVADVVLVPQMYNARRFGVDLSPYPTLVRLDAAASRLAAFSETAPEGQPDAVPA